MKFKNFTPHAIMLNDGRAFESEGIARVASSFTDFDANGVCNQMFGDLVGLPSPQNGVLYIVSAIVLTAAKAQGRNDCVAPATGHPLCKRNDAGHIVSVPGFVY